MLDVSIYLPAGKNKTLTLVRMLWENMISVLARRNVIKGTPGHTCLRSHLRKTVSLIKAEDGICRVGIDEA
jgi:hypothetical protein